MRVLLLDNYDSFTWNLAHALAELGASVRVRYNDVETAEAVVQTAPDALVISPGPGRPENAGVSLDLVRAAAERRLPLLGVCLGHQAIGVAYGARVVSAPTLKHGKTSVVTHDDDGLFEGVPNPTTFMRYHSLTLERETMPLELEVTATSGDGAVMGLRHRSRPIWGVQFHPESILSPEGPALLLNFLTLAQRWWYLPAMEATRCSSLTRTT